MTGTITPSNPCPLDLSPRVQAAAPRGESASAAEAVMKLSTLLLSALTLCALAAAYFFGVLDVIAASVPFLAEPLGMALALLALAAIFAAARARTWLLALLMPAAVIACGPYQLTEVEALRANKAAQAYAAALGAVLISVSGQDSEPDGYVSGEIRMPDGASRAIRCSYRSAEAGCTAK